MSELSPALVAQEFSGLERVQYILPITPEIAREKGKLSPTSNGLTLKDITGRLRLTQALPNPENSLQSFGIVLPPGLSALRKGEIITALLAGQIMHEKASSNAIPAAALLLSSHYEPQMEIRTTVETARKQDQSLGRKTDLGLLRSTVGELLARPVETGKLDRLVASCIAVCVEQNLVRRDIALDLARSFSTGKSPNTTEAAALLSKVQVVVDVARVLRNSQPRFGLKPDDVSFTTFGRVAFRLVQQAQLLDRSDVCKSLLLKITEQGKVPQSISSLKEVLNIVDQNPEIRGVSFDLYDTLVQWTSDFWDRFGRFPQRAHKVLREIGVPISEQQFKNINDAVWEDMWNKYQAHGVEVPLSKTINEIINRLSAYRTFTAEEYERLNQYFTRQWYRLELETAVAMPGARETLEELKKRGIKVCLTSNASWSLDHVRGVLNRFGLLDYFDSISISAEIGKMKKPNQADFFHHSWKKLGIDPKFILHVGDNPRDDVEGARYSGAKAVHYNNLTAYSRLERANMRVTDPKLYAQTVVAMQKESLEMTADEWINFQLKKRGISESEHQRVSQLAKELYVRTRDVIAPLYLNYSDRLLQQLNDGQADRVLCLARDGLPIAVAMKLLLRLDPERYPNVTADKISYLHSSRGILRKVVNPTTSEDQILRKNYLAYLRQKGLFDCKRITIADIVSGEGNNFRLLKEILSQAETKGYFLDVLFSPGPEKRSFLQESLGIHESILNLDTLLFHLESLYNGPFTTTKEFIEITTPDGTAIRPNIERKKLSPHVLTRGLSEQSVLFLNYVATRGILDATKIRYRARLTGINDPTDRDVTLRFVDLIRNVPLDDLRLSIPWQDGEAWFLPSQNEFEDRRIKK